MPVELLHPENIESSAAYEVEPGILLMKKPFASILMNITKDYKKEPINKVTIAPMSSVAVYNNKDAERLEVLDSPSKTEILNLYLSQTHILMREAVYANRAGGEWFDDTQRSAADDAAERVGLEAVNLLATMDAWKAEHHKPHFVPKMPR